MLLPACGPAPKGTPVRTLYSAEGSTEAIMTFDHFVEFAPANPRTPPSEGDARTEINAQLDHLFGPMAAADVKAVPKGNPVLTRLQISPEPRAPGRYRVSYHYEGTIVLANRPSGEPDSTYTILLPIDPDTIYDQAIVKVNGADTYPCTDSEYFTQGDFWYFWNPAQPGCPLQEGRDYERIEARIRRIANTVKTYPEYARLADSSGVITIDLFFGMDDPTNSWNPDKSADTNASNEVALRTSLLKMGFQRRVLAKSELREIVPIRAKLPYTEELSKQDPLARIVVRLYFGATGIDENSTAFHYLFKNSLEHSSLMIYDGHSGLGGHLDLPSIEEAEGFKIQPALDRYQIYYFNSCSSYTYYNRMFFDRKRTRLDPTGTRNLDILTNGLETAFYVMHDTDLSLVRAIDDWARKKKAASYQDLAQDIDSGNLFGVNGDEDNPTSL